jgi:PPP family 3-phenylpropionic acid transporter
VLLGLPTSFWPLLLAMGLFALFQVAIIPLSDAVTAAAAAERGIPYGHVRLWGSIGFGLGGILLGQAGRGWGLRVMFPIYALLMLLALPVAWQMVPHEPPSPTGGSGSALSLLRDRSIALFLLITGLAATGITVGYVFVYVFLSSLGASPGFVGAVSAAGALAEGLMMLWSGRLIRKRGAPLVFAAGMALCGLSWGLFAGLRSPELGLLIQILNGAGTGLLLPATVTFMAQRASFGRIATAQSLLSAVMFGVAPLAATQLAGAVYDAAGARVVLWVAAGLMSAGVLLLGLVQQRIWPPEGESGVERPRQYRV